MKKNITLSLFLLSTVFLYAQSWGENGFLYKKGYLMYPDHIKGFRSMTVERWIGGAWVNAYRQKVPQIDAQLSPLSIEGEVWNTTSNTYRPSFRQTCTNTANGSPKSLRNQTYNLATAIYKNDYRDTLNYRANGLVETHTSLSIPTTGTDYFPSERDTFIYDAQNRLKFRVDQEPGILVATGELVWGNGDRDSFLYDAQNRVSQYYQQPFIGRYVELQRNSYKYDAQSRYQTYIREGFNGTAWDTMSRHNFIYTGSLLTQIVREVYILTGRVFLTHSRISFQYDAQGRVTQELMESLVAGAWQGTTRTTYTYQVLSTNDLVLSDDAVKLSPNPTARGEKFTIDILDKKEKLRSVSVYDLTGKQIFALYTEGGQSGQIDSKILEAGLYLVKIETGSGRFVAKKLVIR